MRSDDQKDFNARFRECNLPCDQIVSQVVNFAAALEEF
jgi:hypothetical protein